MAALSIYQCPDCARVIRFSSDKTNLLTCGSCGTTIFRNTDGAITSSAQSPVIEKNDIIQPGTTGKWNERSFTVLGRFRLWLEESVFNYWTILFSDGETAWLGEGYGLYSILLPVQGKPNFTYKRLNGTNHGNMQELEDGHSYILKKKQVGRKWDMEGELFVLSTDSYIHHADFSSEKGEHITIFEWPKTQLHFYKVQYVSFESLSLQQLRDHRASEKKFTCSNCKTPIQVKTFPYAQSCACSNCGVCYELRNTMDFVRDSLKKVEESIFLPIGSTGKIDEIDYEVIGFALKEERNAEKSVWSEYTLFNPVEGFAFLSVYAGHWIYVREKGDSPIITNASLKQLTYDNEPFLLYNSYSHNVIGAVGEFPYNIFDNEKSKAREFISPPEMWIEERSVDEGITWYFAKHIRNRDVEKAFTAVVMPPQIGTGAIQPKGFISIQNISRMVLFAFLILVLVHVGINMTKQEKTILDNSYTIPDSSNTLSFVTEKFKLDKWRANMEFDIQTSVYNNWFELGATLVNDETGQEYSLEKGVEYYAGVSEGESWTEGSQRDQAYLNAIPSGTYFLQLQGTIERSSFTPREMNNFHLRVTYDVPTHRNLILALILLSVWPLVVGIRTYQNETNRWSNSPYSNYHS
jgi:ribosomal protein S27E